jgi:ABC-type multidrug transport system ATPase subunit
VSFCPQHDVLWPTLSPREHLSFFAMLRGDLDHDTDEMLAWLGLGEVSDRAAGALSGGMRRRLSLAIAAVGHPRLIIADEVSSGLDPANQAEMWHLMDKLKRGDAAILLTTHSMQEAERLADEVAILTDGRVCARGPPLLLKRHLCAPSQRSALAVHLHAASLLPSLLRHCEAEVQVPSGYRVQNAPMPGKPNSVLLYVQPLAQHTATSSVAASSFATSSSGTSVPSDHETVISALLQELIEFCQRHTQHNGPVQSWDLRSISLGDVFERVTLAVRDF